MRGEANEDDDRRYSTDDWRVGVSRRHRGKNQTSKEGKEVLETKIVNQSWRGLKKEHFKEETVGSPGSSRDSDLAG